MTDCEICGSGDGYLIAIIEGARLSVCPRCANMGQVVSRPQSSGGPGHRLNTQPQLRDEKELVEAYDGRIRNAIKKMGLTTAIVAERINEKESTVAHVAAGKSKPTETLAKKLEHELGIVLLEDTNSEVPGTGASGGSKGYPGAGLTLGDILDIERRKKK